MITTIKEFKKINESNTNNIDIEKLIPGTKIKVNLSDRLINGELTKFNQENNTIEWLNTDGVRMKSINIDELESITENKSIDIKKLTPNAKIKVKVFNGSIDVLVNGTITEYDEDNDSIKWVDNDGLKRNKISIDDVYSVKSINEDFYSKDFITELNDTFDAVTTIDKEKNIKPLYGGGTFTQIGYLVTLNKSKKNASKYYSKFILEGLTDNGEFLKASLIVFDKEDNGVFHGSVDVDNGEYIIKNIENILKDKF